MPRSRSPLIAALLCCAPLLAAQETPTDYEAFRGELDRATSLVDPAERTEAVDALWERLLDGGRIPYADGGRVALLYRHEDPAPQSVAWHGDFTRWRAAPGERLGESRVWIHETTLPDDARTDYKIVVDKQWLLDPGNPHIAWSGFGPNSELRMPRYAPSPRSQADRETPKGDLSDPVHAGSDHLPCGLRYRVYTPHGYEAQRLSGLPAVYVTDGHEYADPRLGAMVTVLDNLIADRLLRPTIAVFIDPRDAATGANRRMELYVENDGFTAWVAEELVAEIDRRYRTDPGQRTILGTSLGGMFAGWAAGKRPRVFGAAVLQSPGFGERLIEAWNDAPPTHAALLMTGGTLGDDRSPELLADWLEEHDIDVRYTKVNDGHAWTAWRNLLPELLVRAVGPPRE